MILLTITILLGIISSNAQRIQFKDLNHYTSNLSIISTNDEIENKNNIMIALHINNHVYSLPTFLATLETLKCPNPNSKCHFWVMFENCNDDSKDVFISWLSTTRPLFDLIIMIDTRKDAQTKAKHVKIFQLKNKIVIVSIKF
jgi:hypothetical protein